MIAHLRGRFLEQRGETVIVDVGGVGYESVVTQAVLESLPSVGAEMSIVIHTDMRDSGITLFGFSSFSEREVFLLLRKVNGVGPRTALNVVSNLGTNKIYQCIGSEDVAALKKVPGVGKKTAERIIVDLREHVNSLLGNSILGHSGSEGSDGGRLLGRTGRLSLGGGAQGEEQSGPQYDALLALTRLGFSREQADVAVARAMSQMAETAETGAKKSKTSSSDDRASEILRVALANIPLKA